MPPFLSHKPISKYTKDHSLTQSWSRSLDVILNSKSLEKTHLYFRFKKGAKIIFFMTCQVTSIFSFFLKEYIILYNGESIELKQKQKITFIKTNSHLRLIIFSRCTTFIKLIKIKKETSSKTTSKIKKLTQVQTDIS